MGRERGRGGRGCTEECHNRPFLPFCLIFTCDTGKGEQRGLWSCSCSPWLWDSHSSESLCLATCFSRMKPTKL